MSDKVKEWKEIFPSQKQVDAITNLHLENKVRIALIWGRAKGRGEVLAEFGSPVGWVSDEDASSIVFWQEEKPDQPHLTWRPLYTRELKN